MIFHTVVSVALLSASLVSASTSTHAKTALAVKDYAIKAGTKVTEAKLRTAEAGSEMDNRFYVTTVSDGSGCENDPHTGYGLRSGGCTTFTDGTSMFVDCMSPGSSYAEISYHNDHSCTDLDFAANIPLDSCVAPSSETYDPATDNAYTFGDSMMMHCMTPDEIFEVAKGTAHFSYEGDTCEDDNALSLNIDMNACAASHDWTTSRHMTCDNAGTYTSFSNGGSCEPGEIFDEENDSHMSCFYSPGDGKSYKSFCSTADDDYEPPMFDWSTWNQANLMDVEAMARIRGHLIGARNCKHWDMHKPKELVTKEAFIAFPEKKGYIRAHYRMVTKKDDIDADNLIVRTRIGRGDRDPIWVYEQPLTEETDFMHADGNDNGGYLNMLISTANLRPNGKSLPARHDYYLELEVTRPHMDGHEDFLDCVRVDGLEIRDHYM